MTYTSYNQYKQYPPLIEPSLSVSLCGNMGRNFKRIRKTSIENEKCVLNNIKKIVRYDTLAPKIHQ